MNSQAEPAFQSSNSATSGDAGRIAQLTDTAKGQVSNLYGTATEKAQAAWSTMQRNPFAAVAGAAVVGAGVGWLLPSSDKERAMLADVAHKVSDVAQDAANTAVEAGRQQIDNLTHNALASVGGAVVEAVMSGDHGRAA
jgi:ElaB/YqjD/DUF883 family membrane-anchored ribosome-binding protein